MKYPFAILTRNALWPVVDDVAHLVLLAEVLARVDALAVHTGLKRRAVPVGLAASNWGVIREKMLGKTYNKSFSS